MKVIITVSFYCSNLWKSKFMALEKPGKLWEFFLLIEGHPKNALLSRYTDNLFHVVIYE